MAVIVGIVDVDDADTEVVTRVADNCVLVNMGLVSVDVSGIKVVAVETVLAVDEL